MLVVDACVALKWYLEEENSDKADQLFVDGGTLIAPPNIDDEVTEGILKAVRRERITIEEASGLLDEWQLAINLNTPRLYSAEQLKGKKFKDRAIDYALRLNHPYYDCQYLALADIEQCALITADQQFYQRAKSHYDKIILLGAN